MALDGLEQRLRARFHTRYKVNLVRYRGNCVPRRRMPEDRVRVTGTRFQQNRQNPIFWQFASSIGEIWAIYLIDGDFLSFASQNWEWAP